MKLPSKEQCLEWAEDAGFGKLHVKDPDKIYILPLITPEIQALIHRAYRECAEAMREEAIACCCIARGRDSEAIEEAIRNLKVEE